MPELTGQMLTEQTVNQREQCHRRQWPADGAARTLQNYDQQRDAGRDLEVTVQDAVLIAERGLIDSDPEAGANAECPQHPAGHALA